MVLSDIGIKLVTRLYGVENITGVYFVSLLSPYYWDNSPVDIDRKFGLRRTDQLGLHLSR